MNSQISHRPFSQRQLRVGELVKQNLGELFIRNEAKIPSFNSKLITVTEVKDEEVIKLYERYLNDINGETKEQDLNRDLGFLPSIPEARVILEKLYKKKNNS